MSDKLTLQIIEDLKKRNKAATNLEPLSLDDTANQGLSLYEQLSNENKKLEIVPSDKKSGALHGVGALVWNALDSALIGTPGLAYEKITGEDRPYRLAIEGETDIEGLATLGAAAGQAAGFVFGIGKIGAGVRGVVSATNKLGTSRIVGKSIKEGAEKAAGFGLNKDIAESAIQKGLKHADIKGPHGAQNTN